MAVSVGRPIDPGRPDPPAHRDTRPTEHRGREQGGCARPGSGVWSQQGGGAKVDPGRPGWPLRSWPPPRPGRSCGHAHGRGLGFSQANSPMDRPIVHGRGSWPRVNPSTIGRPAPWVVAIATPRPGARGRPLAMLVHILARSTPSLKAGSTLLPQGCSPRIATVDRDTLEGVRVSVDSPGQSCASSRGNTGGWGRHTLPKLLGLTLTKVKGTGCSW